MQFIMILLVSFFTLPVVGQDTTNMVRHYDGSRSFWLQSPKDTTEIHLYPNGKKESECPVKNWMRNGLYRRWYDNGKMMWEKELKNNIQDGKTVYYSPKGSKVAEFIYQNGQLSDTVFLANNIHLIIGKLTYHSKIYGGVERADGTSNISEITGPMQKYKMYAARVDSFAEPVLVQHFKSDWNGDFIVLAQEGKIGFFPGNIPIEKIPPGQFSPLPQDLGNLGSVLENWTKCEPVDIKQQKVIFVNLLHHSEGYAP